MAESTAAAFFSYCREDSDFALRLAEDLKAAGASVWLDQLDIMPGQRWDRAVEDALANCTRMLVILSPASVNSTNVMDEVSFALEEKKTVIPVIYKDCTIPFRLRRVQYVDFRNDHSRGLRELLKTLAPEQKVGQSTPVISNVPSQRSTDVTEAEERERAAEEERRQGEQERLEQQRKRATEQARLEDESRKAAERARLEQERKRAEAQDKLDQERRKVEEEARQKQKRLEQERKRAAGRTVYVLHSAIAANSVADVLRRSIDEEHRTLFSLSGYRGNRPLLGEVGENTFRLQKRKRYSRNDFVEHFYARFDREPGGTRIEGHFDASRRAKYFVRIWLAGAVLIGTPIFVGTVIEIITGSHHMTSDTWGGLIVPPVLMLFGTLLTKLNRLLGKKNRKFILEHVQKTLAARIEGSESQFEADLRRG